MPQSDRWPKHAIANVEELSDGRANDDHLRSALPGEPLAESFNCRVTSKGCDRAEVERLLGRPQPAKRLQTEPNPVGR